MKVKKSILIAIALISVSIVGLSLLNPQRKVGTSVRKIFVSESTNAISGLSGIDGPVLVAKIDDTRQAHPQIGIETADLVYIEQVEGGLTRLAAIFSSKIPKQIGPIRSARISDIELLSQFGYIGFAYSGAQKLMRPIINQANLADLGAQNHSSKIYTTDPSRIQPYAMVLRADLLMQYVSEHQIQLAPAKNLGWNFGRPPSGGIAISKVHLSWPASSYDAQWSTAQNRWLLMHSGEADFSQSGVQLGPKTLVVQNVKITPSQFRDKVGGVTPFSATVGTGSGYILRDGKYFAATWSRPTQDSGTHWQSMDGHEIKFAAGQIWVALTDTAPLFTLAAEDAASSSSK